MVRKNVNGLAHTVRRARPPKLMAAFLKITRVIYQTIASRLEIKNVLCFCAANELKSCKYASGALFFHRPFVFAYWRAAGIRRVEHERKQRVVKCSESEDVDSMRIYREPAPRREENHLASLNSPVPGLQSKKVSKWEQKRDEVLPYRPASCSDIKNT